MPNSSARPAPPVTSDPLSHLDRLEAESLHILREVAAGFRNPVLLYSVGKDSSVLLHLLLKAFYPARPPIPLLHVDTGWKFREMIAFRDRRAAETGLELRTHTNPEGLAQGVGPFSHGAAVHTDVMKTQALKQALDQWRFDAAIVDFPDPTSFSLGKLYTTSLYRELRRALAPGAVVSIQSTSPLVAPNAYWTVASTLEAAGFVARGYHVYVPSFGEWGFMLAAPGPLPSPRALPAGLRFLNAETERLAFAFPPDMARRPTPVNRLDNQVLVREFEAEWARVEG